MESESRFGGYCERAGPEFWAEPLNAVTNLGFVLAGLLALYLASRLDRRDVPSVYLSCLLIVIGIGSFLFHTFSTRWAAAADVIPIMLFILTYFTVAMNRLFGFSWLMSALLTIGWVGALVGISALLQPLRPLIGGTVSYFPAFLGLLTVGAVLWARGHAAGTWLLFAANVFAVSLTFRALDLPFCATFDTGTHFLWHLFNALVLGTLTIAVVRHGRPRRLAASAEVD